MKTRAVISHAYLLAAFQRASRMLKNTLKQMALLCNACLCGGKSSVTTLTDNGSIFTEVLIGGILKHHCQGSSWGGTYSANDIHIIKWVSRSHRYNHEPYSYEMKILQNPVGDTGRSLAEAMARDLRKAAEIFTPELYKLRDGWPAHLLDLKELLEGAKQASARKPCFVKSLSQHPAIMPSSDRVSFLTNLDRERYRLRDIMLHPPTAYPNGWKAIMQSAIAAEKRADKDGISLLETFYTNDNRQGDKYDDTAGALIRFIRNVIVHNAQYRQCQLEWYFAKIFSRCLPSIMRTLLDTGRMEQL
uniref:Uncharacterized protein n=1 Tax=Avena sativa TaxID=4498 RepID=A0ACD5XYS3_AVESA